MNKSHRSLTVEEAKIKTSILLKSFSSNATEKTAKRFKRLPEFAGLSTNEILQTKIKRKQALFHNSLARCFKKLTSSCPSIKKIF